MASSVRAAATDARKLSSGSVVISDWLPRARHVSCAAVAPLPQAFRASGRRLDALVCNAAVYLPTVKEPRFTADGFELSVVSEQLQPQLCLIAADPPSRFRKELVARARSCASGPLLTVAA